MARVSIVGPDDGERVPLGPSVQMRVLKDGSTTGHRLGLAVSRLGSRTLGAPQHRHLRHDEGFSVVSGLLRSTIGDEDHDAGPGRRRPRPSARNVVLLR